MGTHAHNSWIFLLEILVHIIAVQFYPSFVFWVALRACQNTAKRVKKIDIGKHYDLKGVIRNKDSRDLYILKRSGELVSKSCKEHWTAVPFRQNWPQQKFTQKFEFRAHKILSEIYMYSERI